MPPPGKHLRLHETGQPMSDIGSAKGHHMPDGRHHAHQTLQWAVRVSTQPDAAKPLPNRKDRRRAARDAARALNRARKAKG